MMTIHFRAVNFTADAKLKEFSKERIEKLALFHNQILEVFVFTKVENSTFSKISNITSVVVQV